MTILQAKLGAHNKETPETVNGSKVRAMGGTLVLCAPACRPWESHAPGSTDVEPADCSPQVGDLFIQLRITTQYFLGKNAEVRKTYTY